MSDKRDYPYEIKDVDPEESAKVFKYFSEGFQEGYLRIGPKGYWFSNGFKTDAPELYNMPLREDDLFVVTFPKSGTTWVQELVWVVANNLDYETAKSTPLPVRFPFLEVSFIVDSKKAQAAMVSKCNGDKQLLSFVDMLTTPGSRVAAALPSPRFIKSHVPLSLLPPGLLDTTKVVYVARDPRDVAVSYYHHNKFFQFMGYTGDFRDFWQLFINDQRRANRVTDVDYTPLFPHVLEAWEQRRHPNMLFLFYEDLLKDLPAAVRRVATFLDKELSEEQVGELCDHLSFRNFKNNKSVNFEFMRDLGWFDANRSFVRKGKAGDWRDYFDEKMTAEAKQWMEDNLRGTDLRYPHIEE